CPIRTKRSDNEQKQNRLIGLVTFAGLVSCPHRNQGGNGQPQQSLHQEEDEAPESQAFYPGLDFHFDDSIQAARIKISALSTSRAAGLRHDRTTVYIPHGTPASGGTPKTPTSGISKAFPSPIKGTEKGHLRTPQ